MLRTLILSAVLLAGLQAAPGRAQDAAEAIRSVISGQIAAFRENDFERAFSFASPSIRRMFGNPTSFGSMVRHGYPMVWRPADVRFSGLRQEDGRTVQSVLVTDQEGALYVMDYEMVQGDGGWQIDGVTVRRAGDAGA